MARGRRRSVIAALPLLVAVVVMTAPAGVGVAARPSRQGASELRRVEAIWQHTMRHWRTSDRGNAGFGRVTLTGCSSQGNWPQFRYDPAHTGNNPNESCLSTTTVPNLAQLWHYGSDGTYSDPVVAAGKVVLTMRSNGSCSGIEALNATTGKLAWKKSFKAFQCTDPVEWGGNVYLLTRNPLLIHDWNLATGSQAWQRSLPPGRWSSLTGSAPPVSMGGAHSETLYTASRSGRVVALGVNGKQQWAVKVNTHLADFAPALAGNRLYLTSQSGVVYALGTGSGHVLWTKATGVAAGSDDSTLAVSGYRLFVDSSISTFYAVGIYSHKVLWKATGDQWNSDFATDGSRVYITTPPQGPHGNGPSVFALSAATGKPLWNFNTGYVGVKPTVANGVVYVSNDGVGMVSKIFALKATTGAQLWSARGAGSYPSYPSVTGGAVYVSNYKFGIPKR